MTVRPLLILRYKRQAHSFCDLCFSDVATQPSGSDIPAALPLQDNHMSMWWFDAYEDGFNKPGVIYLFGKVCILKN